VPIYDYVCRACGQRTEVIHGVHDAGPAICPNCGGPLRKAVSAPTIHFRGSGWAKSDRAAAAGGAKKSEGARSDGASVDKAEAGKSDAGKSEAGKSDSAERVKSDGGGKSGGSAAGSSG
jgi:putative FmdB family regulatory protein